jgi:hypothetical protein
VFFPELERQASHEYWSDEVTVCMS